MQSDGVVQFKRIESLESIRFFIFLMIFISHLEFLSDGTDLCIYENFFHNANMGVNFFFMISGFGLTLSSLKRKQYSVEKLTPGNMIGFAGSKVKKTLPLYVVTMLAMAPEVVYGILTGGGNILG